MSVVGKPGYQETDVGRIPDDWLLVRIRDLGCVITGNTPRKADVSNYGKDIPWVSPSDIEANKYVFTTKNSLSAAGAELARLIPKGSVLVTCIASIGKNAIAARDLCTNQQINSIVVNECYCNEYVYYCVEHHGTPLLQKYAGKTAVSIVSKGLFEKLALPFPAAKPEQQKIAAILTAVDDKLDVIARQIEATQTLKRGLMQTLFRRGGGTQDADDWSTVPLQEVAEIRTGVAKGKKGLKDPVTLPYLRVANVQDGHIDLSEVKTIEVEAAHAERYALQAGDVLMTEGGDFDKLGRGDVWGGQISPCLHQNHVFAVRPNPERLDSRYLAALAASDYGRQYFLSCSKRTTNLASINSSQLKAFPVLLPSLAKQRKIAAIVAATDDKLRMLEARRGHVQTTKRGLMQKLLTGEWRVKVEEPGA